MEETVAKARMNGLSENDRDTVTAIDDLIPSRRSEGRWRKVKKLQRKNIEASSKMLDAERLITLVAMETLARSHPVG
jgi:hypothetical protein